MFTQPALPGMPARLCVTALVPEDASNRTTITVTLDPPSDRFELVWYQDTITDVLVPDEVCTAVSAMVNAALDHLVLSRLGAPVALDGDTVSEQLAIGM